MTTRRLGRASADSGVRPTINVTPLVDVVLVLLIIFMVVIPQLDQDVSVDLPSIFNADPDTRAGEPFKIHVPRAGEYHFGGQVHSLDGLAARLAAEHAAQPLRRLLMRVDGSVRYADVRVVQDRLRAIGFPGMSFGVNVKHRREGAPPIPGPDGVPAAAG